MSQRLCPWHPSVSPRASNEGINNEEIDSINIMFLLQTFSTSSSEEGDDFETSVLLLLQNPLQTPLCFKKFLDWQKSQNHDTLPAKAVVIFAPGWWLSPLLVSVDLFDELLASIITTPLGFFVGRFVMAVTVDWDTFVTKLETVLTPLCISMLEDLILKDHSLELKTYLLSDLNSTGTGTINKIARICNPKAQLPTSVVHSFRRKRHFCHATSEYLISLRDFQVLGKETSRSFLLDISNHHIITLIITGYYCPGLSIMPD